MTVKELIEKLKEFDENKIIYCSKVDMGSELGEVYSVEIYNICEDEAWLMIF